MQDCKQVANSNIKEVFTEVPEMSKSPKIIQHYVKHCIHSLASDVMGEQEVYKGKTRTHTQWSKRQIAHILGDFEELGFIPLEEVVHGIHVVMFNTALYAERERLTLEKN